MTLTKTTQGAPPSEVKVQRRPQPNPDIHPVHWLKKLWGQIRSCLWYYGRGERITDPKGSPCRSQAVRRMVSVSDIISEVRWSEYGYLRRCTACISMGVDSLSQVDRESAP